MNHSKRMLALLLSFATSAMVVAAPASAASTHLHRVTEKRLPPLKVLDQFKTKDGRSVTVVAGDMALVKSPQGTKTVRYLPDVAMATHGIFAPNRSQELAEVNKPPLPTHPYQNGVVLVVLRSGTGLPDVLSFSHADLAAKRTYSGDASLNSVLAGLGVNHVRRLLTSLGADRLAAMRSQAPDAPALLPLENMYLMQFTRGTVSAAMTRLRRVGAVLDAEPNFYVSNMNTYPVRVTQRQLAHAKLVAQSGHDRAMGGRTGMFGATQSAIPTNYAVAYSAQSALNAPGVNAIAAYDEIERHFHELPGAGEIITNVSLGDVVDASVVTDKNSPCYAWANYIGDGVPVASVALIGGQHYLEMPSLPAIPAYVANDQGALSGSGSACGQDDALAEVGLDFSVMAALPHQLQQPNETGSGYSDLLGVAPGATYRLVVPETTATFVPTVFQGPTTVDIVGALLGAASQNPAPNVINMSIGFGFDQFGFPSRYFEEDPVTKAAVSYVVSKGIVLTIAAGDGLRMYTNAPIGPSGGTVALDTVTSGGTDIADDEFSTTPSLVPDSGAIAVGGTTLDDIMSAPPYQAEYARYRDQLTFPEVRWNGFGDFASTFGTRVNISAPSDNILAEQLGQTAWEGGTSAAAPMVAAGAAIALQVARLTGKPFRSPAAVRRFLVSTARPVPNVLQADVPLNVGPQLDVANEVETLLRDAHMPLHPVLNRVAIAQRYPLSSEFVFSTDTDPTEIDLTDANAYSPGQAGSSAFAPITIAPDWEELPAGTKFRVFLEGNPHKVLGTGPWVRVFPQELLAATNQSLYSTQPRTVSLTYVAYSGFRVLANESVALTFAPNGKVLQGVGPAPTVPAVVTGPTIPVQYDISAVDPAVLYKPALIVSYPGRMSTWTSGNPGYKALYSVPITQPKGTIQVPVSALQGSGIYGIAVQITNWETLTNGAITVGYNLNAPVATTWAYTRVATSSARPAAPILTYNGNPTFPAESGHAIDVPYNQPFQVQWDANNVKGATGATLEISSIGPSLFGNYNMFNNPNGSELDHNDVDSGSVYKLVLPGTRGSTIVNPWPSIGASDYYSIRVLATSGSQVVGEAGDVSTIITHGIIPSDGGSVLNGFSINQGAYVGILASNQLDSTDRVDSSVEVFDPQSQLIDYTIASQSTDAGPYSGTQNVPMYSVSGFGMDPDGSAFFAVNSLPWLYYPGYTYPSSLEYIARAQQLPSNTFTNCYQCVPVKGPFFVQASMQGVDYLLSDAPSSSGALNVTPIYWTNGKNGSGLPFGTPWTMPAPSSNSSLCAFTAGGSRAIGMFNGPTGVQLQLLDVATGSTGGQIQTSNPVPLSSGSYSDCNVSAVGTSVATTVTGAGGQGELYSMPAANGNPQMVSTPLVGYYPLTLTQLTGSQILGWAAISGLSPDYLTNFNATSTITIVDANAVSEELYGPIGSAANLSIPLDNRLSAAGPNGLLYLIGANGYEIAPFTTGL